MQTVAQSWLVLKITGSGTALGLVVAFQYLPVLVIGPFGGVITDRFNRRKLLMTVHTLSGIWALILGMLVLTNTVQLWMIFTLAALYGLSTSIENPTRHAFVQEMVGEDHLSNAITLNSTIQNLAKIAGPAIAGIIIISIGFAPCFLLNAFSYLAIIICLLLMDKKALHIKRQIGNMKGQLLKGFRYIWENAIIRDILVIMTITGILTYEFNVSLALFAKFTFQGNASAYAFLTSALGLGAVIGGLATARKNKKDPKKVINILIYFGLVILVVSFIPNLFIAEIGMMVVGFLSIMLATTCNTIIQLESSSEMRGRVMALWTVAIMGTTPIGSPIVGAIGQYNARFSLAIGGVAALIAATYGYFSMKKYPMPEIMPANISIEPIAIEESEKIS